MLWAVRGGCDEIEGDCCKVWQRREWLWCALCGVGDCIVRCARGRLDEELLTCAVLKRGGGAVFFLFFPFFPFFFCFPDVVLFLLLLFW